MISSNVYPRSKWTMAREMNGKDYGIAEKKG